MRAVVYDSYGPVEVLQVREVPDPVPAKGELLVRVRAAALNPKDSFIRKGRFKIASGRKFPRQMGFDWAGEVVADPSGVYPPGTKVWGSEDGFKANRGTAAELFAPKHARTSRMPERLKFEEAAAIPLAAQTALQALRDDAHVRSADRVCIHGASGGVGVYAIQLAKLLGAHVTTVSSAKNRAFCGELGADETLAYDVEDPFDGRRRWQVIFDAFGNQGFAKVRRCLEPQGVYVTTVPSPRIFMDTATNLFRANKARMVDVSARTADLEQLARWVTEGKLKPVIDRVFPLDQVRDAMALLETKRTRGKIVLAW